ncbi:MAG: hypothetical protein WC768_04515 [Patescibacteria group bacterium]
MSQLLKSISRQEWFFVVFLVLVMIIITTAPLLYGWLITPPNQVFTGIHFAAPNDWFVYYSYLEQVREGNWLFKDLFTAEPNLPVLNLGWLGVGLLAKIFSLNNILAFNLARVILIPVFYFVAYLFLALIFSDLAKRKIALVLLSFASGLGIFLIDLVIKYPFNFSNGQFNWPMDLWVPESNTFLTLYYSPHFIASLTLILLIFLLAVLFIDNKKLSYGFWAGILALALFSFHPFHVPTVLGVILAYFIVLMFWQKQWQWPLVRYYSILLVFSLPAISYYFYLLKFDWVTIQKFYQNLCFTTPFAVTLFSYGLLLVFSLVGIYFLFKDKTELNNKIIFIIVWFTAQFFLIYSPVNFQRRLTEGLHFPLVVLAAVGLFAAYNSAKQQKTKLSKFIFSWRYVALFILIFLFSGSNIFALATDFFIYRNGLTYSYLDKDVVAAASWLKNIPPDKVIFNSADYIINILPAFSSRKVYVGHGVETPSFGRKQLEVNLFFQRNREPEVERDFLLKRNTGYIFYSISEKELGSYNPDVKAYLKKVFENPQVKIYQVLPR